MSRLDLRSLLSTMSRLFSLVVLLLLGTQLAHAERKTTYFHTDGLGSVVAASDDSGNLLWRKEYAPYGEQLDSTSENEKLAYTGKEHDDVTGLTYFGARYYDPHLGRFMSVDPVGFVESNPMSFNRYAYANGNPYRFIDPDGRSAIEIEYKGYMVQTGTRLGRQPLGHGGVLLINDKTGLTKYYEYGRYDAGDQGKGKRLIGEILAGNDGNVRKVDVPDVMIGKDGKPTEGSLKAVYSHLSKVAGQGKPVKGIFHAKADFDAMEIYVTKLAGDKDRARYNLFVNSCFDFADDVADSGRRAARNTVKDE